MFASGSDELPTGTPLFASSIDELATSTPVFASSGTLRVLWTLQAWIELKKPATLQMISMCIYKYGTK